jgi:hypothetical protein
MDDRPATFKNFAVVLVTNGYVFQALRKQGG